MNDDVIVDVGSYTVKAGVCRDPLKPDPQEPSVVVPTAVRLVHHNTDSARPQLSGLQHPVKSSRVEDWDQVEAILHHILHNRLGWGPGAEGNLMWVDGVRAQKSDWETLAQVVFEVFNATGFFVIDSAVAALYSVDKVSGVAIDMGHGGLTITPVDSGRVHTPGRERLPMGGQDLDEALVRLMEGAGESIAGAKGNVVSRARAMKEVCIRVGESPLEVEEIRTKGERKEYRLPDGQTIELPSHIGTALGEVLFKPATAGLSCPGLSQAVLTVVAGHPEHHLRRTLIENIFIFGGGSPCPGLRERLATDLKAIGPASATVEPVSWPDYMPKGGAPNAAFHGGAILAKAMAQQAQSQTSQQQPSGPERQLWVTRMEYAEEGPVCVRKRCG